MKHLTLVVTAVFLVALIIGGSLVYLNYNKPSAATLEKITIGNVPVESFALLYVANNQHFFAENGLDVTIQGYSTGATAVNALISSQTDIAGSSEYVVVLSAVQKQNISIIASCGASQFVDLIGRNDHGIFNASDLNGKTVATAKNTVAAFDLGRFLEANGMTLQNITLVYLAPSEFAPAIVNGSIDAVVSWEPYTDPIKAQLGTGFVTWPLQTDAPFYSVLSCRNDWITNHPQTLRNLLRSLAQAENYISNHKIETQQIIKNRFNYTDTYLAALWSRNTFELSLTQTLAQVMQEEAAWMINNNLTAEKTLPIISDFIETSALKAVKSEAVNI